MVIYYDANQTNNNNDDYDYVNNEFIIMYLILCITRIVATNCNVPECHCVLTCFLQLENICTITRCTKLYFDTLFLSVLFLNLQSKQTTS